MKYIFFFLLFNFFLQTHLLAETKNTPKLTQKEQQWIKNHPTIRVGGGPDWAPFDFVGDDGTYQGIAYDYLQLISQKTGLHFNIIVDKWANNLEKIKDKKIDLLHAIYHTDERAKYLTFTDPYFNMLDYFFIRQDLNIKTLKDLDGKRVAIPKGYAHEEILKKEFPLIKIITVDTFSQAIEAVLENRADLLFDTYAALSFALKRDAISTIIPFKAYHGKQHIELHMATQKGNTTLINIINKALRSMTKEEKSHIYEKWLTQTKSSRHTIYFSQKEKTWINQHPTIKIGVEAFWPPIDFVNDRNISVGIAQEYLKLISQKANLTFEKIPNEWTTSLNNFKKGELDLLSAVYLTPQRTTYMNFSDPYFELLSYFFIRDDLNVKTLKDLNGKSVAIAEDNGLITILKKKFPKIKIIMTHTLPDAIDAVLQNRADMLFENIATISYILKKEGISTIIPFKPYRQETQTLHFCAQKKNQILISIINKTLKSITPQEKNAIFQKWVLNQQNFQKSTLKLTKEEREWLIQNPSVTFAGDPNWLPFEAFDKKGRYIGIVADYLKKLMSILPITFQPQHVSTWLDTIALAKKGKVDVISETIDSENTKEYYTPITSYLTTPIVIVMRDTHDFVNDISDISDQKIALIREYGYVKHINENYPQQPFTYVENADIALEKLTTGEIDAAILSMPKAGYLIRTKGYTNLKIVGKTSVNLELTLFVLKSKPILHKILERAMKSFSIHDRSDIVKEWQTVEFAHKTDYTLLFQIAGILGFFLLGSLYWNSKLSKEIQEREKIEKALKESEQQIHTLIDYIPVQIIVTTYSGEVLLVNPQTLKDYGFKEEDLDNASVIDFYADTQERDLVLKELKEKGQVHQRVVKFKHPDGSRFDMMLSMLPIQFNQQDALLSIAVNISQRLEIERTLALAKEKAEQANHAKSEFLANMSHEIRTPMNSILGFSELLEREITDPVQKDYLESISRGGNALLSIINDILDLSKIEAGKLDISYESVDIKKLAQEIETLFSVKLIQKNLHFKLDIDPNLPKYLLLDSTRIRQILFNLIGNAIKFTHKGTISLSILAEKQAVEKSKIDLKIIVKDSGIGIQKDYLPHIFDAFGQQAGQSIQKYGGTGLGLAICKKLTQAMHGKIEVESEVDKGSTFSIFLPDIAISSIEEIVPQEVQNFEHIDFEPATIMIVDDIQDNRKLVSSTLQRYDFNIIEAIHGQDALEKLENIKIDLIFMDIKMPVMDGYEATQIIKHDARFKQTPIIALTASVMGKDLEKISTYHFNGYLRKPVSQEALLSTLGKFIAHKSLKLQDETSYNEETISANLPHVIEILETTMFKRWEDVKDKGDFSLIESFANALQEIAKENEIRQLSVYATQLLHNCESFDIDKIDFMMHSYTQLIEKLREVT